MTLGPVEANLRGEIALDQIRAVQDSTWPGLQGDLERGLVREIADAHVVPIDAALSRDGAAYGVRISRETPPAPIAPNLEALPGRYRAWVLPSSGVAVALEPLEDEGTYLRAHRTHLLELQGIPDDAALRRRRVRIEGPLRRKDAHQDVVRFDGVFTRATSIVFARLVIGIRYRVRRRWVVNDVIEPVAPEIVATNAGPYR